MMSEWGTPCAATQMSGHGGQRVDLTQRREPR